jgi:hypothetical protein
MTALPPLSNLESRLREDVQNSLENATKNCSNAYSKGKRSFEIVHNDLKLNVDKEGR